MTLEEIRLTNAAEFISTLEEVAVLLDAADSHEENEIEYAAFNKSALLLLTGKFENFAESIAEDYIACINNLQPCCTLIPHNLRLQHTFKMLADLETYKKKNKQAEAIDAFLELGSLWVSDRNFTNLNVDCKFSYGKHGESELKKLFSKIGIDNLFEEVQVFKCQETFFGNDNSRIRVDFKGTFNSITGMRNNILHQNASPSLTTPMVRNFKEEFQLFAQELETHLNNELLRISKICLPEEEITHDTPVEE